MNEAQREKDALTQKLHTHEEEFKLQNETMMRELNEVNPSIVFTRTETFSPGNTRAVIGSNSDSRERRERK